MKKLFLKFKYAFHGLWHGFLYDHSIQIQYILALLSIVVIGMFFDLNESQWLFVMIVIGLVLAFEYLNSALEQLVDIIIKEYDERAKHIKDYAAASVLIICILALILAGFILL